MLNEKKPMSVEISELKVLVKELLLSQKDMNEFFKQTDAMFKETDALFKETDAKFKETDTKFKETDAKFKDTDAKFKDTDAKFKETDAKFKDTDAKFKDTDARFKETDKRIQKAFDYFESQWGKLMESLVEGDLVNILRKRNIKVTDTSMRRKGHHEGQNYEFDIIAHNGDEIVIVEVKTTLKVSDVKNFVSKLKNAKIWMEEYKNHTIYGAIAYLKADAGSEIFAENQKLFVIKATGDSASIINSPDFIPAKF